MKERNQKKTVLITGEGATEVAFLTHLKSIYAVGDRTLSLKIKNAYGGGPISVLERSIQNSNLAAYDVKAVWLDNDGKPLPEPQKQSVLAHEILIIESNGCVECFFLRILGTASQSNCDQCKRNFRKYVADDRKSDPDSYRQVFPRELLENMRSKIPELDSLIRTSVGEKLYP